MLSSIRNKTKGAFAYLIVGLITVPFALFGISEYFTGRANIMVAEVNGTEISGDRFLSIFNANKRRIQQELGDRYNDKYEQELKSSVINSIIDRHLLDDFAKKLGQAATIAELRASIQTNEEFKENGVFSEEKYQRILRINGYNYAEYEQNKLSDLVREQVKYNLLDSAFIVNSVLKNTQKLSNQEREFDFIALDTDNYLEAVTLDKAKIQAFYDKQKDSFFEPFKIRVDFVELSLSNIQKEIEVNDDDLLNFYEEEKERFTIEEERQAQHILLESEQEAKKVATLLAEEGDFAKLAKTYSRDESSKNNGGDLGFFTIGVMTPEFEKKVFAMKIGELSAPIKTEFGYHIIKLTDIHPVSTKAFDDKLRPELLDLYTQQQAQKRLYDLTEQLTNLAYEVTLESVAEQMSLSLKTSEFFAKNSDKYDKKFINGAFNEVVLTQSENSNLIELPESKFVILRLKDSTPKRQKTFSEVEKIIKADLTNKSAKKIADDVAQKITTELTNNNDKAATALMEKHQLKWQKVGRVKRGSNKANTVIIDRVFSLPKPDADKAVYRAASVSKSQSVVIKLSKVSSPDYKPDSLIEKTLLDIESEEIMSAILAVLKQQADIEIYTQKL